ncbi:hypothetical protein [Endozoicomonas ascidiicola]|uniref:hypothetical protein n=1 Tax=Endozoicomonas ascidiicola TaxID=1698521 RepID=UPI0012FC671A|nr:hypothetical protein [Endozoicomonas ascidiicola]
MKADGFSKVNDERKCSFYISDDLESQKVCKVLKNHVAWEVGVGDSSRIRKVISIGKCKYFLKVNALTHRNERIRTTLRIKRRGTYDWVLAEIDNGIRLAHLDYIPKVKAYGFKRNRLGLVTHAFVLMEFVESAHSVQELINKFPCRVNELVYASFGLIYKHIIDGFIHLDLWLGNIMLSECLKNGWLIDLEYCKFTKHPRLEEKLGYCLGYYHRHTLSGIMSLEQYLSIFNQWHQNTLGDMHCENINSFITKYSMNETARKTRFEMF